AVMCPTMPPPIPRPRAREHGLQFGDVPTGTHNAITDVPGVRVGQVTVWHGDGDEPIARTGTTVIVPDAPIDMFQRPMAAAPAVLNGAGELTGSIAMKEWGVLETPIALTGTSSVGRGYDALVDAMYQAGADEVVVPVVGECDDSRLDDFKRRWLTTDHVRQALTIASDGPVAEGVVGAGAGMVTLGFKAGIGTSSRVLDGLGTIGVLLLCNFGSREQLRIGGVPVGRMLPDEIESPATFDTGGSCLGVVMTDLPLDARQLARVALRVGMGLARMGSVAHHGSGDIFCAVSTTNRQARHTTGRVNVDLIADGSMNDIFPAIVDAAEEAVCNALFVADTCVGIDGVVPGLPIDQVLPMLRLG
ncbi:MAG: Aminopeptidase, partial [Ilumatobacteraceae bacterium]|nr:Aminopeptidase [Ilumatobacteraceae bacterium]